MNLNKPEGEDWAVTSLFKVIKYESQCPVRFIIFLDDHLHFTTQLFLFINWPQKISPTI